MKRFIQVGSCYINPWSTAAVMPLSPARDTHCSVVMHSGEQLRVDAPLQDVVDAIERVCADDSGDEPGLVTPVGHGR